MSPSQSRCLRAASGGRGVNLLHALRLPAVRAGGARPGVTKVSAPLDRFRKSPCTTVDEQGEPFSVDERRASLSGSPMRRPWSLECVAKLLVALQDCPAAVGRPKG